VGVITELGAKIKKNLRSLEINMASMSRTEASRCRTTHIKLTRDFQGVETKFRKLDLDSKRKRDFIEAQQRDNDRRMNEQNEFNDESMHHQMLMQENVSFGWYSIHSSYLLF